MSRLGAVRTATGRVASHRVQALVIGVVLAASTASATLGIALLAAVNGPFQQAFAAHHGADVTLTVDPSRVSSRALAATRHLPGVTAVAGPFPETTVELTFDGLALGPRVLAARPSPGGPVDDVTLSAGHWPDAPGQVVLYSGDAGPGWLGDSASVRSRPGVRSLTVVGFASSVTRTADGWVAPGELARLGPGLGAPGEQVLYRFAAAGSDRAISSDVAEVRHALPAGAVTGAASWLTAERKAAGNAPIVQPFIVGFALLGLVTAALVVANIVGAAVVGQYRRIGVLKSIGFAPTHVAATYLLRIGIPAAPGCVAGVVLGNLAAIPVLHHSSGIYGVGEPHAPLWSSGTALAGMLALTALAALVPALRASRLSAVEAIAAGRAPRAGHGRLAHRIAERLPLPLPVRLGVAAPFARPSRGFVTLASIALGTAAAMFAVGLTTAFGRVQQAQTLSSTAPVQLALASEHAVPSAAEDARATRVLRALGGTERFVAVYGGGSGSVQVPGLSQPVTASVFGGNASWLGYSMIAGRWFQAPGEVVVNAAFVADSGLGVGDRATLLLLGREDLATSVRIVGEVFAPSENPWLYASARTLPDLATSRDLQGFDVALRRGTRPSAYVEEANRALTAKSPWLALLPSGSSFYGTAVSLLALLAVMVVIAAGLGVLNTTLMSTRDRVHDLGILQAIGMRPRQLLTMVVCQLAVPALLGAAVAVPVATALTAAAVQAMATAAHTAVPPSFGQVLPASRLALLGLAAFAIAATGALLPASWAARARPASALQAE